MRRRGAVAVRRATGNLLLLLVATVLALGAAELGLRAVADQPPSGSWLVQDARGLVLNRSSGTVVHHWVGRSATYRFRPPHLRAGTAGDGRFRILVLGDSFTFGWLLNWRDSYVGWLEARLRQTFGPATFAIADAATGGWGLDSDLAYLEGYGDAVKPDVVVLFVNTDDVARSERNGLYRLAGDRLVAAKKPVSLLKRLVQALPLYDKLIARSYLLDALRRAYLALQRNQTGGDIARGPGAAGATTPGGVNGRDVAGVVLAQRVVDRMVRWCRRRGATFIVLTTAWFRPPYRGEDANIRFIAEAPAFFAARGTPFFDGSAALMRRRQGRDRPLYIAGDGHPNEEGARLIAEINWPFLAAELRRFCRGHGCAGGPPTP